jgi:hypothetical protein
VEVGTGVRPKGNGNQTFRSARFPGYERRPGPRNVPSVRPKVRVSGGRGGGPGVPTERVPGFGPVRGLGRFSPFLTPENGDPLTPVRVTPPV